MPRMMAGGHFALGCGLQVLAIEAQLAEGHPGEAALLRRVQEGERDKLRWTLTLQARTVAACIA